MTARTTAESEPGDGLAAAQRAGVPGGHAICSTYVFGLSAMEGIDMSGRRPLIKGYFAALRLIVGAVMSSAC
jgi:hypothetical protein